MTASTSFSEDQIRRATDLYHKIVGLPQDVLNHLQIPIDRWTRSMMPDGNVDNMIASLTGCSPTKVKAWKNRWGWKSLADIVVFDPDTVIERADYSHPQEYPDGIEWVVVNGQITVSPDGHTGARAGRTL